MADTSRVPLLSVEGLKKYYTAKSGMFSRSAGVVRAVERRLGADLDICQEPEIVGASGAALYALEQMQGK